MSNPMALENLNHILNFQKLRDAIEEAFRQGFNAGVIHGTYNGIKTPSENIAFIKFKQKHLDLFVCASKEELKMLKEYEDCEYYQKIETNNQLPDCEEDV